MNIPFFSCIKPFKRHNFGPWKDDHMTNHYEIWDSGDSRSDNPSYTTQTQVRICTDCGYKSARQFKI